MENSADLNDFLSGEEFSSYEEMESDEMTEPSEGASASKASEYKVDSRVDSRDDAEPTSPQPRQISERIADIKRRYTRRISLFELTGILCESFNLLQRGRLPLVSDLSDETFREQILHVVVREIEEGTCPVVIQKNGELLSVNDFDPTGLRYHLDYVIDIWKQQRRY
ncbi:DNA-dependent RNA polymerase 19 kD subunit [Equine molluscum contagiosum-like virus]|nr:DNA-dependent RNA polymerase 19 kD subunit [Equine molluscum contagiosum-like virus]